MLAMGFIAMRLVLRSAAATECHGLPDFAIRAISQNNANPTTPPDRPATMRRGIFDQSDRDGQLEF